MAVCRFWYCSLANTPGQKESHLYLWGFWQSFLCWVFIASFLSVIVLQYCPHTWFAFCPGHVAHPPVSAAVIEFHVCTTWHLPHLILNSIPQNILHMIFTLSKTIMIFLMSLLSVKNS
ncbi:unnamed protein product [Rangifer tarandus platyrhynchus]|uniref:Uncharacterized protein n=1 Tax=Rangifer tarandus platyrhynchus TaxID=3082113 RepID=A0AC59YLE7_RANTA